MNLKEYPEPAAERDRVLEMTRLDKMFHLRRRRRLSWRQRVKYLLISWRDRVVGAYRVLRGTHFASDE